MRLVEVVAVGDVAQRVLDAGQLVLLDHVVEQVPPQVAAVVVGRCRRREAEERRLDSDHDPPGQLGELTPTSSYCGARKPATAPRRDRGEGDGHLHRGSREGLHRSVGVRRRAALLRRVRAAPTRVPGRVRRREGPRSVLGPHPVRRHHDGRTYARRVDQRAASGVGRPIEEDGRAGRDAGAHVGADGRARPHRLPQDQRGLVQAGQRRPTRRPRRRTGEAVGGPHGGPRW